MSTLIIVVAALLLLTMLVIGFRKLNRKLKVANSDVQSLKFAIASLRSMQWLDQVLSPPYPLPTPTRWTLSGDVAAFIAGRLLRLKPELVVEFGSGFSSLIIALVLKKNGSGKLVAIEHDAEFIETTRELIERFSLSDHISLVHAPLANMVINGESFLWYEQESLEFLSDKSVDFMLVDGPPAATCQKARMPALYVMRRKLKSTAQIFVDDADRNDERAMMEIWKKEFGMKYHHHQLSDSLGELRFPA